MSYNGTKTYDFFKTERVRYFRLALEIISLKLNVFVIAVVINSSSAFTLFSLTCTLSTRPPYIGHGIISMSEIKYIHLALLGKDKKTFKWYTRTLHLHQLKINGIIT
jgi:hypothetical protein